MKATRWPIDHWLESAFFDFKMEFPANTKKPQQLIDKFQLSMAAAVNTVYEEDVATCILHRDKPDSLTLRELPDSEKIYSKWSKFFHFDSDT